MASDHRRLQTDLIVHVLVLGAGGFIGSALVARLVAADHFVTAVTRTPSRFAGDRPISPVVLDINRATHPEDWAPHLAGIDAVVNCAGVLQDGPGDSTAGVHMEGVAALFRACERAGVRRVVHLSAVGVDPAGKTAFSRTKFAGEQALIASELDWVILRPSVVIGRPAYGGSALLRGLAALPVLPIVPDTGPLQLVHLDDVLDAILFFLQPGSPCRHTVDLVGPKRFSLSEAVRTFRTWLGWKPAPSVHVPRWLAALLYRLGDLAGWLGWRPPLRGTSGREIKRGAVGDPAPLTKLTGIAPRDVERALASEPASVQERWFASLYLLKAVVFGVFSLFWIATGLISLGPGWEIGMALMREGGVRESMAVLSVIAGGLADIAIGVAIAVRRTTRYGLYAALCISVAYAIIGTILVPRLWSDPLGPMLKIWPILALNLVALAIHEDR